MSGAAMAQLPSALVLASVAIFFGLLPRAAVAGAWTAVGLAVAIALFGQMLQLSHWVMGHLPVQARVAAARWHGVRPLVWLCLIALALTMAGLAWPAPPRPRPSFGNKGASALHRLKVTL